MSIVSLTVHQLLIMSVYIILGYVLMKMNVISKAGSRDFSALLVKLIIPAVIVNSFCTAFSAERLVSLAECTLMALILLALAMAVSALVYRDKGIENFCASFSNAGFMGIPLVRAIFGDGAVFYIVPFVALLNMFQWTYGADLIRGTKEKKSFGQLAKTLLVNPPMIAIGIGLIIFVSGIGDHLPSVLDSTIKGVCALNTPLAMMILGVYMAEEKGFGFLKNPALYSVSVMRLLIIPALSLAVLYFLPFGHEAAGAVLICAAAPAGANAAVYARLYDKDSVYASEIVVLSTILCLLSLPAAAAAVQNFLG